MDLDYIVPNLPFPFPVTYGRLLEMCEFLTNKYSSTNLDNNKEGTNGFNLHPEK
jgi:hypothetical protein